MRFLRGWAVAAVTAVAAGLLSGGAAAGPAAAGSDCAAQDISQFRLHSMRWTPSAVVIGSRAKPETVRIDMNMSDPCVLREVMGWAGKKGDPNQGQVHLSYMGQLNDSEDWADFVVLEPYRLHNDQAGTWNAGRLIIENRVGGSTETVGPSFTVKRASTIANNASPEPVREGSTITVKGSLTRISWNDWATHGYGHQAVELQFRTPTGSYAPVRALTTSSSGAVTTKITASRDGCFRYVFAGSTTTAPAKGVGDCVDVT